LKDYLQPLQTCRISEFFSHPEISKKSETQKKEKKLETQNKEKKPAETRSKIDFKMKLSIVFALFLLVAVEANLSVRMNPKHRTGVYQGCQMVYFQTKNPNQRGPGIGKCWFILWPFGIYYDQLVYYMAVR
jgi:hypothetical protein